MFGFMSSVTFLGYIVIPLGVFILLTKPDLLIFGICFFCGWSGASVLNIGEGLSIQPAYYFAVLFIISKLYYFVNVGNFCLTKFRGFKWMLGFMGVATLSLIMPFVISQPIFIINVESMYTKLAFSNNNITQLMYLWFCFIFFVILMTESVNSQKIEKITDYYLIGIIGVVLITLYQLFAFSMNLPFDEIFRSGVHGNVQGERIYGPCNEASMLAYYLLSSLPLWSKVKNKAIGFIGMLSVLTIGIISFSSTFVVGVALFAILVIFSILSKNNIKINKNYVIIYFVFGGLLLLWVIGNKEQIVFAFQKLIQTVKIQNVSGNERIFSFVLCLRAFLKSPFLGIGFGSSRSADLFSTWLANVGSIGIICIFVFLFKVFTDKPQDKAFVRANILIWTMMMISVTEPYNLFIWIMLSCCISSSNVLKTKGVFVSENNMRI